MTWQNNNKQNITHTHTQPFNSPLSGTTRVGRYQEKHSPTHTHPDHQISLINFLLLLRSTASSLFNLRASESFSTPLSRSSLVYLLVWGPLFHTPYISSPNHHFCNTCPYHCDLFCCSTNVMSSIANLTLSSVLGNLSFTEHNKL